jgi:hypothetical protein
MVLYDVAHGFPLQSIVEADLSPCLGHEDPVGFASAAENVLASDTMIYSIDLPFEAFVHVLEANTFCFWEAKPYLDCQSLVFQFVHKMTCERTQMIPAPRKPAKKM